jgi:hypothetical protein
VTGLALVTAANASRIARVRSDSARRDLGLRLLPLVGSVAATVAACGGGTLSSPDGGSLPPGDAMISLDGLLSWPDGATADTPSTGTCGENVPAGQACNTLQNMESPLAPSCASGSMPAGTGGTIVDGTYILTSYLLYGQSCTSPVPVAETLTITGDCIQLVLGDLLSGTFSGRLATQGNMLTTTLTCQHIDVDGAVFTIDTMKTYTATATSITLFTVNTVNGTPDGTGDVATFTRR